jgi:hypothetical protein
LSFAGVGVAGVRTPADEYGRSPHGDAPA